MFDLSANKSRTSRTSWQVIEPPYPCMEMGSHHYGFCGWIAESTEKSRYYLGSCGYTHQVYLSSAGADDLVNGALAHLYSDEVVRLLECPPLLYRIETRGLFRVSVSGIDYKRTLGPDFC